MEYIHAQVTEAANDPYAFILWLGREGFLNIYDRICRKCRGPMHVAVDWSSIDHYCMSCNDWTCHRHQSIRCGSFFEHSHLSIENVLHILIDFVDQITAAGCAESHGLNYDTVLDYYQRARMQWSRDIRATPISFTSNSEYEADEAIIDYASLRDGIVNHSFWVGGILERETGKCKLYSLGSRSVREIIPHIVQSIPRGALVYTDELNVYSCLSFLDPPYEHYTVNHSRREYSREQDIGGGVIANVHINGMEAVFSTLRSKLRYPCRRDEDIIQIYLDEMMYRSSGRPLFNLFKTQPDR